MVRRAQGSGGDGVDVQGTSRKGREKIHHSPFVPPARSEQDWEPALPDNPQAARTESQ